MTEFEGLLVEIVAGAIAAGAARLHEEQLRTNLSGFFSQRMASLLAKNPDLLTGRDAEVTVLFCDLRGFSSISETHGTKSSIKLINEFLTELSQCVVDFDGVLVDYVGDELLAMWGAPGEQRDHAQRAVSCARAMLVAANDLSRRWMENHNIKIDIGIGINSGVAQVGNVGSSLKFKYGVLGHPVNLGSRVEGACKHLGVRCVVSDHTAKLIEDRDCLRRLGTIRVAGIGEAVVVHECKEHLSDEWCYLKREYELALSDYYQHRAGKAVERLTALYQKYENDMPTKNLLRRAVEMLVTSDSELDTVWDLKSK